jgi:hypothetical protein
MVLIEVNLFLLWSWKWFPNGNMKTEKKEDEDLEA